MPTMREILAAAAHGTYAEIDGVGNVVEQMFRDFVALQQAHETFLRRYGHIVQAPQHAHAQPHAVAPPIDQPLSPPPRSTPAEPVTIPGQLSPEEGQALEDSIQNIRRMAGRFSPGAR